MEKEKIVFLFLFFSLLPIIASAQFEPSFQGLPEWFTARGLAGVWIFLLIASFGSIVIAFFFRSPTALGIGVAFLFGGIVLLMSSVLVPLFTQKTVAYEQCVGLLKPDVSILAPVNWFYATSCILTGYAPEGLEWLNVVTFFVFGIILPLALLIPLFYDFIPEGMIVNRNARKVIGLVMALFAFRGFFATFFIELLSYGFTGVGALLIGVLVSGIVYNSAKRLIMPLGKHVKEELRWDILAEINRLNEEIRNLERAKSQLTSARLYDTDEANKIDKAIKEKSERIKELEKKASKLF